VRVVLLMLGLMISAGCSDFDHPPLLGDCTHQPCGAFVPAKTGSSSTPPDSGVPEDSGIPIFDAAADAPTDGPLFEDTGVGGLL
jgi:hypothetical protein